MRPANLIPPEERRSSAAGLRAAPVAYIIVAALLLAIGGVALLTVAGNEVSEHKTEVAEAEQQTSAAEARASELAAYTSFRAATKARTETITNLANSRFGWEKVLRQVALVQPHDIQLTDFGASVRSGVSVGGSEGSGLRAGVAGPALVLVGCGDSLNDVANYVTELKEIEGVTRVGLQTTSAAGNGESSATAVSAASGCGSPKEIDFQLVAAFDAAPIPAEATAPVEAPVETTSSEGEGESSESSEEPEGE